jgi:uncharacterized protein HemY
VLLARRSLLGGRRSYCGGPCPVRAYRIAVLVAPFHAYRALARCGRRAEANKHLDEARRVVADNEERWWEPEVWRIEGLLALDAGARFQDALASARRLGLRPWGLRAATTLARLWAEQGKWKEAHTSFTRSTRASRRASSCPI